MQTNDRNLTDLMASVHSAKAQLPDFQRGWVWDDDRIKALIASITSNYPVGAAMFLAYGNEDIRFKHRTIENVQATNVVPDELILDGQQRLTSIYSSLYSKLPVRTHTEKNKNKDIYRYYYIDIAKAIDPDVDRTDAIISISSDRVITSDFGRVVEMDLSTREAEFKNKMFPLNIILDFVECQKWQNEYYAFHEYDSTVIQEFTKFNNEIVMVTYQYKMPVILLDKDTPKEAVCQVFENVNTGGVSLTVFELVTAIFAMDDFELRKDWAEKKENYFSGDILDIVEATDFLTACTLYSQYTSGVTLSCKKSDILNLKLTDYKAYADVIVKGFVEAESILQEERIFSSRDLPYSTQLIPMATLCALLLDNNKIKSTNVKKAIKQWYWCGVMGELYGGANNSRYANDVKGVMDWVKSSNELPKTILDAYFSPMRLLGLQSRQSAAYKGIMALILQNHPKDFISGKEMDFAVYKSEYVDIHHIFPKDYCEKQNYPKKKWNSVVNKTPITYSTNREIGGVAPSAYLSKIENKKQVNTDDLNAYLDSHFIDHDMARKNRFDEYFINRAKAILDLIENVMGKPISGRDSEDVISSFGGTI
ncbi:MAG: DUF262 domain-containing protein [Firmicutes bacterium]|nr:DUF262 domain-containing protein [Bacillota bacterium]